MLTRLMAFYRRKIYNLHPPSNLTNAIKIRVLKSKCIENGLIPNTRYILVNRATVNELQNLLVANGVPLVTLKKAYQHEKVVIFNEEREELFREIASMEDSIIERLDRIRMVSNN
jgi:hypothetical protein